jgi:hypothetical protein
MRYALWHMHACARTFRHSYIQLCGTDTSELPDMTRLWKTHPLLPLQEEFSRKRSKGKLPDDATLLLKKWWDAHLDWPYPSVSITQGGAHPMM